MSPKALRHGHCLNQNRHCDPRTWIRGEAIQEKLGAPGELLDRRAPRAEPAGPGDDDFKPGALRPSGASREVELQSAGAILNVRHLTTYRYKRPVEFGDHRMMMRPRDGHDQRLLLSELDIDPEPRRLRWLYDTFDNCVAIASFSGAWTSLRIENRFTVERIVDEQPGGEIDPRAQFFPFSYLPEELPDIARAMERLYSDPAGDLDRWVRQFVTPGAATLTSHLLMTMTYAIKEGFSYERREAAGVQTPVQTLDRARLLRDFAVLMMEAARALGVAARFVSGYVYVPRGDDEPVLVGGATHACVPDLPARRRLDRIRPDQRPGRRQGPDPRRGGARSRPGGAADRRIFRRSS